VYKVVPTAADGGEVGLGADVAAAVGAWVGEEAVEVGVAFDVEETGDVGDRRESAASAMPPPTTTAAPPTSPVKTARRERPPDEVR